MITIYTLELSVLARKMFNRRFNSLRYVGFERLTFSCMRPVEVSSDCSLHALTMSVVINHHWHLLVDLLQSYILCITDITDFLIPVISYHFIPFRKLTQLFSEFVSWSGAPALFFYIWVYLRIPQCTGVALYLNNTEVRCAALTAHVYPDWKGSQPISYIFSVMYQSSHYTIVVPHTAS